jgi:HD domain/Domain of unknown function (DUF4388)
MDKEPAAAWLIRGVQQPSLAPGQDATSLGVLEIVALTAEYRRLAAGGHNWRVAQLAALLAKTLGLGEDKSQLIKQAAPLHDIGTIFIPEQILRKPAKLSSEEFAVVKRHVELGTRLLQASDSALLQTARTIIGNHHERFDGSGYPLGKKGEAIPLIGQIVALADVFDTLTHPQPYRPALSIPIVLETLREARGKGFAPNVVDALLTVLAERYWLVRGQDDKPKKEVLLQGNLGILTLFDLLGSLTQNKKSGTLYVHFQPVNFEITSSLESAPGLILIEEGRILHADFEGLTGEVALLALFIKAEFSKAEFSKVETSSEARFTLESGPPSQASRTIQTPTEKLLFDIAVKLDHEMAKRNPESQ